MINVSNTFCNKGLVVAISLMATLCAVSSCTKETYAEAYSYGEAYASAYALVIVDDDTVAYNSSTDHESFNSIEKSIADKIDNYAVSMLTDYNDGGNVFLSPVSASSLYSMMANFVGDNIDNSFKEYLGLDGYDISDINSYNRKLNYQNSLGEESDTSKFVMKNKVWLQENSKVYHSFISTSDSYKTLVKGVDFKNGAGINEIDDDIKKTLGDSVKGLSGSLSGNVSSLITTTMDLKKKWASRMKVINDTFTNANNSVILHEYLSVTKELKYASFNDFDLVEIPLSDEAFSIYIVYPHEAEMLDKSLSYIKGIGLEKSINDLTSKTYINLHIPQIKSSGLTQLNRQNLANSSGVKQLYSMSLSKVSPDGFFCGDAFQLYSIDLNQSGISVSVKSAGSGPTSVDPGTGKTGSSPGGSGQTVTVKAKSVHLTHPFAFFIRNNDLKYTAYACIINTLD